MGAIFMTELALGDIGGFAALATAELVGVFAVAAFVHLLEFTFDHISFYLKPYPGSIRAQP